MKKYKTGGWKELIEECDALRETEHFVYLKGSLGERRVAKRGEYDNYFNSWEEAHNFLLERAEAEVEGYQNRLESAKGRLDNIKVLKKP